MRSPSLLLLSAAVNARQAERREREMERENVIKYYKEQRDMDTYTQNCMRDDAKRKEREMLERKQQHEMIETLEQADRLKAYAAIKSEEDAAIAIAMAAKAREEDRHARELQRMLANADELRGLEAKVRTAVGIASVPLFRNSATIVNSLAGLLCMCVQHPLMQSQARTRQQPTIQPAAQRILR